MGSSALMLTSFSLVRKARQTVSGCPKAHPWLGLSSRALRLRRRERERQKTRPWRLQRGGWLSATSLEARVPPLRKKQTEILQERSLLRGPRSKSRQRRNGLCSMQEFYEQFEATIALANDGEGMTDMEALVTLKACLRQHRLKSYELIYKRHLNDGTLREDPGAVYKAVKQKHLLFAETREEKELRVLDEWERLQKGRLSAYEWEVLWEERLGEREQVGLGMTARENLIQYLRKIGDHLSREARKDKRYRESRGPGNRGDERRAESLAELVPFHGRSSGCEFARGLRWKSETEEEKPARARKPGRVDLGPGRERQEEEGVFQHARSW